MALPSDLQALMAQYESTEADCRALVDGMDERIGTWRESPEQWSVAICLDHLAIATRVYLAAMAEPLAKARAAGKLRHGEVRAGWFGGWFAKSMEPPVKKLLRLKAPRKIVPRPEVALADGVGVFLASQQELRDFVLSNADLDLSAIPFPNPFVRGLSFSVASGLFIIAAHQRRHLWQARQIKERAQQLPAAKAS